MCVLPVAGTGRGLSGFGAFLSICVGESLEASTVTSGGLQNL